MLSSFSKNIQTTLVTSFFSSLVCGGYIIILGVAGIYFVVSSLYGVQTSDN